MGQCDRCKARPPDGARFCPQCGVALPEAAAAAPDAAGSDEFRCASCKGHFARESFARHTCNDCGADLCAACYRRGQACAACRAKDTQTGYVVLVLLVLFVGVVVVVLRAGC